MFACISCCVESPFFGTSLQRVFETKRLSHVLSVLFGFVFCHVLLIKKIQEFVIIAGSSSCGFACDDVGPFSSALFGVVLCVTDATSC